MIKRRSWFIWGTVITVMFAVFVVFIKDNVIHHKLYSQDYLFSFDGDTVFSIRPFYSNIHNNSIVVFPAHWKKDGICALYKGVPANIDWQDTCLRVGGGMFLYFYTSQPSIQINTNSSTMRNIDSSEDKSYKESGMIKISTNAGEIDYEGHFKSIHGRGNGTWRQAIKKPYNLNMGKKCSVLGMRAGKKYCLLSNNMDRSNAKNFIAYYFSKTMDMPHAVDQRYVSLYLNGIYNGLYLLTNDINVDNTGEKEKFFLEYCGFSKDELNEKNNYIQTSNGDFFRIKNRKRINDKDKKYISEYLDQMLFSLLEKDSTSTRFKDYIDISTFAKYYLLQECFLNYDWGNFYMSKIDSSGHNKMRAVSVWDFDQSMGIQDEGDVLYNYPSVYTFKNGGDYGDYLGIFGELCKKREFLDSVRSIFSKQLMKDFYSFFEGEGYDELRKTLLFENKLDCYRWPYELKLDDIDDIKLLLFERIIFLQNQMWQKRNTDCSIMAKVYLPRKNLNKSFEFVVRRGEFFIPPKFHLLTFRGWKNKDNISMSEGFFVNKDTTIYADWLPLPSWFKLDRNIIKILSDKFMDKNR